MSVCCFHHAVLAILLLSSAGLSPGAQLVPGDFDHSMPMSFPGYTRSTALTNFPALIKLSPDMDGFNYGGFASTNGCDLRFTDSDGVTVIPYEVEEWDTNGASCVWVQVPQLEGTGADSIRAYWGNSEAVHPPSYTTNGAVWSENYLAVWHMTGSATNPVDSTSHGQDGVNDGLATQVPGKIADCHEVDSDRDDLLIPHVRDTAVTASLWYYYASGGDDGWNTILGRQAGNLHHLLVHDVSRRVGFYNSGNGGFNDSGVALELNRWHHLAIVMDGANYKLYHNGEKIQDVDTFFDNAAAPLRTISTSDGTIQESWGKLDEIRVSAGARSADWMRAAHLNMADTDSFVGWELDPDDFDHRMQITFSGYDKPETLTNFPALVELGPLVSGLCASRDGGDLRFTDGDGVTVLEYEVDTWDTNGTSTVWVKVPRLTSGASIWAHFGNASDTTAPAYSTDGSTWTEGFRGVWHMGESNALDSTANGHDGTAGGNVDTDGRIGGAQDFTAGENWLSISPGPSGLADNVTVMGLVRLRSGLGDWQGIITERYAGDGNIEIELYCRRGVLTAGFYDGAWHTVAEATALPLERWVHVAATYDGHALRLYRDGRQVAVSGDFNRSLPVGSNGWFIGHRHDQTDSWDGLLDEIRLGHTTRSSNWVWACAAMMNDPCAFAVRGEIAGAGSARYWDTDRAAGLQSGDGTWSSSTPSWSDAPAGSAPLLAWSPGGTANFAAAGPAVITVDGTVVASGLALDGADHTFSNGTIVVGPGGIAANRGAVVDSTLALDADQVWTVASSRELAVRRRPAGAGGLTKDGAGVLALPSLGSSPRTVTISNGTVRITGEALVFTPPPVPGYIVWLDATDVNGDGTAPAGGSVLNTWVNKAATGSAGDFIGYASGASLPTYVASSRHFNDRSVVRFHGNDSFAQSVLYSTYNFAAPVTVLYVSRLTGTANQRLLSGHVGNWLLGYHGNTCDDAYFEGWVYNAAGAVRPTPYLYEAVITGTGASSFYRNGDLLSSNIGGVAGPNGLRLGGGISGREHSSGEIAELLVYDRALSDEERKSVEAYLQAKWRYGGDFSSGAVLSVAQGGTLDLNGIGQHAGSLGDAGTGGGLVINSASSAAVLSVEGDDDTVFSGSIADGNGAVALEKAGTGVLTLTGTHTYSGTTTIGGGALRLSGGGNRLAPTAAIHFPSTATLGLDGITQMVANITIGNQRTAMAAGSGALRLGSSNFAVGGTVNGAAQTLDLRGLGRFVFDGPERTFLVGGQGGGNSQETGTLYLAATNTITASQLNIATVHTGGGNSRFNTGTLYLGVSNVINASTINLGLTVNRGYLQFPDSVTNGSLTIRGAGGGTSRANILVGQKSSAWPNSGDPIGTVDLTSGGGTSTLDALIGTLRIAYYTQRNQNPDALRGTFKMEKGILDATTVFVGQSSGGSSEGSAIGTFALNGGTVAASDLVVGDRNSTTAVSGQFDLNSGTLRGRTVRPGAGTATRMFNWNGGTIANYDADTDLGVGPLSSFSLNAPGLVFDIDADRTATIDTALSGGGGFLKQGDGALLLNAANTYTGDTVVAAGYLWGVGVISNGAVTVRDGGVLGPAGASVPGTFALSNATLEADARVACLLNGGTPILDVTGALTTATTNWIDLLFAGPLTNGTYALIDYTNAIVGDGFSALSLSRSFAGRATVALVDNTSNTTVELVVSDVSGPTNLLWKGNVDDRWDIDRTANWETTPGGQGGTFMGGDAVRFDDTADRFTVHVADQVMPGEWVLDHSANDYTIGGKPIAGRVGLTKQGTARLVLEGDNTYSGETAIEGGVLQIGDGGVAGSLGTGRVTNDATLVFNRKDDIDVVNQLTGTGVVVQAGSGTLTLSHPTNSYSGGTIVSNGVLALGHGSALPAGGSVTVDPGATFDFNGMHVGDATRNYPFTVAGSGNVGQGAMVNTGAGVGNYASVGGLAFTGETTLGGLDRWDIGTGAVGTWFDGGGYGLTKIGPCEISIRPELLTHVSSVAINEGYIKYEAFNRTNSATASMLHTVATGGSIGSYGNVQLNMPVVMNGGVLQNHGGGRGNWTGSFQLNVDTVVNTSGNNGSGYVGVLGPISGSGGITKVSPGAFYAAGTNSYRGQTDIRDGYFVVQSDTALGNSDTVVTVANGATLQFEGSNVTVVGRTAQVIGTGEDGSRGALCNWTGMNRWEGDVELVGDSYFGAASGTLTIDGLIDGPYTVAKRLAGTIVFAGDMANTYAGTTTVHNGGGFLVLDKSAGVNAIPGDLQIGNNGGGAAWVQLANSNQVPDEATITFTAAWGNWSYLKLMGHSETVSGFSGTGGGVLENTEGENGIASNGVLTVVHDGDYVFNGHIRDKSGGDSTGTFGLTKEGAGMLTLGRVNGYNKVGYSGPTTVNGGTLNLVNLYNARGGDYTLASPIHIASNCTVIVDSIADLDQWRQGAALTGTGLLIKEGSGWFHFDYAGPRGFHGHIIIRGGICGSAYDRTDWSGCTADVTVETNGVLDVRVDPVWIDALNGGGEVHNSYHLGGQEEMPLTIGVANGSGTFFGQIRGTGTAIRNTPDAGRIHLVKVGAGTQVLSGTNTYAGPTTINGGTLVVNGTHTNGQAYAINGGGTLSGTGTIHSAVNVGSGGTLEAGYGAPGTLTLGGLSMVSGATNRVGLGGSTVGDYAQLVVNGAVSLGQAELDVTLGYRPGRADVLFIIVNDGSDGVQGTFGGLAQGGTVRVSYGGKAREFSVSYEADSATGEWDGGNDVALRHTPASTLLIVR